MMSKKFTGKRVGTMGLIFFALVASLYGSSANAGIITSLTALKTYGFKNITGNLAGDALIGEKQLFVDVYGWDGTAATTDSTDTSVLFVFRNKGPDTASITQIYFEDGALLKSTLSIIDDQVNSSVGDVDYKEVAGSNLPGRNNASPPFTKTAAFEANPEPPVNPNGVGVGEELGLVFELVGGKTVANVLLDLQKAIDDPSAVTTDPAGDTLRIGIHVQGFDSGGSESFINGDPPGTIVIPEPGSLAIFALGSLLAAGALGRRRRAKA